MKLSDNFTHRELLAWVCVFAAIGFGVAGTWIAPTGIIDSSILYMAAQLLIFSATILGFGATVQKITNLVKELKNPPKK